MHRHTFIYVDLWPFIFPRWRPQWLGLVHNIKFDWTSFWIPKLCIWNQVAPLIIAEKLSKNDLKFETVLFSDFVLKYKKSKTFDFHYYWFYQTSLALLSVYLTNWQELGVCSYGHKFLRDLRLTQTRAFSMHSITKWYYAWAQDM